MRDITLRCIAWTLFAAPAIAAEAPLYLLQSEQAAGTTTDVTLSLKVGGDLLVRQEAGVERLPLSVTGKFRYQEQLLAWSPNSADVARALRNYDTVSALIEVDQDRLQRTLPAPARLVIAEIRGGQAALNGLKQPLSREQLDLLHVVGNTLGLNRLLPGREVAEGDRWDHDAETIGALLGMDHVAVCDVRSVVTGESHRQVQLRLAGTVHGTIDGAPTEIELRGAYLYHLVRQRITKFNLAIQERRSASDVVPGLDVVARVSLVITPATERRIPPADVETARNLAEPLDQALAFAAPEQGFRFVHDTRWYITAQQRQLLSLRYLQDNDFTAHCNVTTLPSRSAGRETTLEQFERDVRDSLGERLETVVAATRWSTRAGHDCLGIIARGQVADVPVEWRYYLVSSPNLPRASVAVTVEQSRVKQFADADRQLVETLDLFPARATTAAAPDPNRSPH